MTPPPREVRDHEMDVEAVTLANSWDEHHHRVSTSRYGWVIDVATVLGLIAVLALLMLAATVLGELAGGWPA